MKTAADLPQNFRTFLLQQEVPADAPLVPVKGGGNNQVFRLDGKKRTFALKQYFQHPVDLRDRFNAERRFYSLLWDNGVRLTPEPFGWDAEHRLGLFSFLEGRKLKPEEVTRQYVEQALEFVQKVNALRNAPGAQDIPNASDGYFSIPEQIKSVAGRVAALQQIEVQSEVDQQTFDFAKNELASMWQKVTQGISIELQKNDSLVRSLNDSQLCLSASDFGYHNALLNSDRLQFIDFEYAGWDDPAKLVCDFFCQPQIPVSLEYWDQFNQSVAESLGMGGELSERTWLLFPVFQMKWCCIILNPFIKVGRARREFAGSAPSQETAFAQLEKARHLLQNIKPLPC